MPVYMLDEDIWFPPVDGAREDGLLAVGGDLKPKRLMLAYMYGIFPWYNDDSQILWWCPKERYVIYPSEIHVSRSMKKFMKKTDFTVTLCKDFDGVIEHCRALREHADGTWITDGMEAAYKKIFRLGYGISVEVWDGNGKMVGGLYGLSIGRVFYGESMFSLAENASKLALITLSRFLEAHDFEMIDCQFHTEHLESMGGRYISYEEYMEHVKKGLA